MALTVSSKVNTGWVDKKVLLCDIAFDSSYPTGGETFNPAVHGISTTERVMIEPQGKYQFEYDYTNSKIKVFAPAPAIVIDEIQSTGTDSTGTSDTTNQITLNYPAAYIMWISQLATPIEITDTDATLASNQCKPTADFAAGSASNITLHAGIGDATDIYITYVTQAWTDVWGKSCSGRICYHHSTGHRRFGV